LGNKVEKGSELGVPSAFGQLFGLLVDVCEERENFFGSQGA
jgi:hypothetical protein